MFSVLLSLFDLALCCNLQDSRAKYARCCSFFHVFLFSMMSIRCSSAIILSLSDFSSIFPCAFLFFSSFASFFYRWRCVSYSHVSVCVCMCASAVLICWIDFYPSRSSINYLVHFLSIKCK